MIYVSLTVSIFFLGFFGIKQQAIYIQVPVSPKPQPLEAVPKNASNTETDRYKNSGLKKETAERYLKELLAYMEEE